MFYLKGHADLGVTCIIEKYIMKTTIFVETSRIRGCAVQNPKILNMLSA